MKTYLIAAAMLAALSSPSYAGNGFEGMDAHADFVNPLNEAGLVYEAYMAAHAPCPRQDAEWCAGWDAYTTGLDATIKDLTEKKKAALKAAEAEIQAARKAAEAETQRNNAWRAEMQIEREESYTRNIPAHRDHIYQECAGVGQSDLGRTQTWPANLTPAQSASYKALREKADAKVNASRATQCNVYADEMIKARQ